MHMPGSRLPTRPQSLKQIEILTFAKKKIDLKLNRPAEKNYAGLRIRMREGYGHRAFGCDGNGDHFLPLLPQKSQENHFPLFF
jgi:hypothetical protein